MARGGVPEACRIEEAGDSAARGGDAGGKTSAMRLWQAMK